VSTPDRLFRENVRRLHALGPRPVGEYLRELLAAHPTAEPFALERLDRFAGLDPDLVRFFGGADWLEPRVLIRAVAGGGS
jgi:hypothetical protein